MALVIGRDTVGRYAAIECDAAHCPRHVAMRPAVDDVTPDEAIRVVAEWATDEGWWLLGTALCPEHLAWERLGPSEAPGRANGTREAVRPEAAAAAAQRGLTAVH